MIKKINIEDIFLSTLGSNQKLKWYLQYDINLVNYLEQAWTKYIAAIDIMFAFIPKSKRREMIGEISCTRILKILEKERPDLFKILDTKEGHAWLEKSIKNFEERFL